MTFKTFFPLLSFPPEEIVQTDPITPQETGRKMVQVLKPHTLTTSLWNTELLLPPTEIAQAVQGLRHPPLLLVPLQTHASLLGSKSHFAEWRLLSVNVRVTKHKFSSAPFWLLVNFPLKQLLMLSTMSP